MSAGALHARFRRPLGDRSLAENVIGILRPGFLPVFFIALLIGPVSPTIAQDLPSLPATPKKPVVDRYHGVDVTDDYRWLENAGDSTVRQWSQEQNRYARAVLERLPARKAVFKRLERLYHEESPEYRSFQYRTGVLFALKSQPPKEQPLLVILPSLHDPAAERIIIDVNQRNPDGTTAIDFYAVSLDGRLVAVSLSEKGSEDGTVHVFETATGRELADVIPRVNGPTAGGSVAWNADGSGFHYTRYPRGTERPKEDMSFYQQVYFHKLGTPTEQDTYAVGREFPRVAEIELEVSDDGRHVLAAVANGDGGEYEHYFLDPTGVWTQIARIQDEVSRAAFGPDNAVYLLSKKDAPRGKILRLAPGVTDLTKAATIVAEDTVVIRAFVPTATRLYVIDIVGGPSQVRVFDHQGRLDKPIAVRPVSSVGGMLALGGDTVLFTSSSYVDPPAWYIYEPVQGAATRTALYVESPADFTNAEVVREFATSKDGTRIPLNIIRPKGIKLDGQNPTILYGYGGFNSSQSPYFDPTQSVWLDQGGVYVVANLRGGSEYGEAWHRAGNLTHKQNVFDDFAAAAQYLITAGYTNPAKLAIMGGSNGGLLMGAAMTQHPDLFRAVVAYVGYYDMLRFEVDPNGVFNAAEYGSVKDPEQFRALYAYSPYHHVTDGTMSPDALLLTGENDGRVNPAHSRKMVARLQAANAGNGKILLRTSTSSGHGPGKALSERIAEDADVFAFVFSTLGVPYEGLEVDAE